MIDRYPLSLCENCWNSTYTIKGKCGKCKGEKKLEKEVKLMQKTGIPRCQVPGCHKNMVNDIDGMTGKISPYLWKTNCEHFKNLRLMKG